MSYRKSESKRAVELLRQTDLFNRADSGVLYNYLGMMHYLIKFIKSPVSQ